MRGDTEGACLRDISLLPLVLPAAPEQRQDELDGTGSSLFPSVHRNAYTKYSSVGA